MFALGIAATVAALAAPLALAGPADAATEPCDSSRPYRDLNGDGFEDVVVGDPEATVAGQPEAGTVTILFGDAEGVMGGGSRRVLTQTDLGETPEAGDHFGWAVAANRTSIDGCYGIIIGSPGEDVDGKVDAGMGHVLTINGGPNDDIEQELIDNVDQGDVGGNVEAGDEFGYSVAALGGSDEYPVTFAFGAPGENNDGGVVNRTDDLGRPSAAVQERQGSRGLPGTLQAGDRFGEVIQFLNYLPVADAEDFYLYVGAPGDRVDGHTAAGSVTAISKYARSRLITENTSGVPGKAEAGDRFGSSLSGSELPPLSSLRQFAIGVPGEDVGKVKDAGSVTVLKRYGPTSILKAITLTQSTSGVAGIVESGDQFGSAVAYRDDRTLVIGIPGEDVGRVPDAGGAQILRIGISQLSFPSPFITEDSPGTPGAVRVGNRFGAAVAGLPSNDSVSVNQPRDYGEAVFAITSPNQDGGSVYVLSSTEESRAWQPGPEQTGARFGQSVG
ncbi:hypothetical protein C6I20_04945 [Aeromicrobium sp. A1-2]|nr:hypothetical protein C6I20_04945 [Aeromicrobium sp. A1-2]